MDAKIRLAYLIDTINSGSAGTEKQLLEIIRRLDRQKFEVTLICLHETPWLTSNHLPCRLHVLAYRGLLKTNLMTEVRRLMRILEAERIDVLQAMFEDSIIVGLVCRLLRRRHPRVFLVSKRDMGLGAETPWYGGFMRAFFPLACRLSDGVVVNAERLREHVGQSRLVARERIQVIRNGVTLPPVQVQAPAEMAGHDGIRIGIVANLKPIKRLDIFLQALHQLHTWQAFPFQAYLLGDGPERPFLQRQVEILGLTDCVHFIGSVADVTPWLRHFDIGVLCSDSEGLSNAILEYMSCGLPVVATDAGGNGELVDRHNGYLVPAGDARRLAEALQELGTSESRRLELGAVSLERIRRQFTWERIMPQWEEFYATLAGAVAAGPVRAMKNPGEV
jgi:glycosyltransferase involved in cell wall biosynthesis